MSGISVATPRAKSASSREESILSKLMRFIFIALFDLGAIWFIRNAMVEGFLQLVVVLSIITLMINLIFLIPSAYPFRWMAIGFSFLILFVVYPIVFTIYVAFTNYGVDAKPDGDNYKFTLAADGTVEFTFDPDTKLLDIVTK